MEFVATIEVQHIQDARNLKPIRYRIFDIAIALFDLSIAGLLGYSMWEAGRQFALAIEANRLSSAIGQLQALGYGWLLPLGILAVPIAIGVAWIALREAARILLPLAWQPSALQRLQRAGRLGEHHYTLSDQGLRARDERGSIDEFEWSDFSEMRETGSGFYLHALQRTTFVIVPKSARLQAFNDTLRATLLGYLGN